VKEADERLSVNGIDLAWGSWGGQRGPALLLCHGYTGGAHDFILQVDALADDRRVVLLDQRGHGLSTKTGQLAGYTIEQLAEDLIAFIESVTDEPIDLLGHSMGGIVVLGVVLRRPDLVRSLVLMDTSAWSFLPDDLELRSFMSEFLANFNPSEGLPSGMPYGPEDALIEAATPSEWRQRKLELTAGLDPFAIKALGAELLASESVSVRHRLSEVTCPVTVLVGSNDHPFTDQAPELVAELPRARLMVIEGAYHSPQLTHPDKWRNAIEEHLAEPGTD
jgi:pimeloyl-ACP methyl ester carboxylesterase